MAYFSIREIRFLYQSKDVMSVLGSRFADAGKTVRTGHSGAAVSGHNSVTCLAAMPGR
jgi:hypothetical protein